MQRWRIAAGGDRCCGLCFPLVGAGSRGSGSAQCRCRASPSIPATRSRPTCSCDAPSSRTRVARRGLRQRAGAGRQGRAPHAAARPSRSPSTPSAIRTRQPGRPVQVVFENGGLDHHRHGAPAANGGAGDVISCAKSTAAYHQGHRARTARSGWARHDARALLAAALCSSPLPRDAAIAHQGHRVRPGRARQPARRLRARDRPQRYRRQPAQRAFHRAVAAVDAGPHGHQRAQLQHARTRNIAAVIVTAELPAFVGKGSRIDVTVSSLGDATSLAGGSLILTPLSAPTTRSMRSRKAAGGDRISQRRARPRR